MNPHLVTRPQFDIAIKLDMGVQIVGAMFDSNRAARFQNFTGEQPHQTAFPADDAGTLAALVTGAANKAA